MGNAAAPGDVLGLDHAGAARLLGISDSHFFALLKSGRIGPTPKRLGRAVRWDRRELESWFAAGCPNRERWTAQRSVR
jgi:excisionase family DNA binding protein